MGARGPKTRFELIACPNDICRDYGIANCGNIVGNGTYDTKAGRVRKFTCKTCGKHFNSRSRTVFYDLRTDPETFLLTLKMVLNDIPLRKIAYIMDVKLDTVRGWLLRAAEHSEEINKIFLTELKVSKVEMDELWTFVKKKQFREWTLQRKDAGSG